MLREFDYAKDLKALKTFIRENTPVLIGVDAGADALLEAGHRPDLVVTDADEITEKALRCGAEIVAHAGSDGRVRGADRLERLGVTHARLHHRRHGRGRRDPARARARRPADRDGRVARVPDRVPRQGPVGHGQLVPDPRSRGLDRWSTPRPSLASTEHRIRAWVVLLVLLVGIAAVAAAIATTPVGQDWWDSISGWYDDLTSWLKDLFS